VQELGESRVRQLAQAGLCKYSTPQMSHSVYKWRLAGGQEPLSGSFNHCLFSVSLNFLGSFAKSTSSMIAARGLAVNWSYGGEKNCIVYCLFCIFCYCCCCCFLCCLTNLSLSQPMSFTFFHSPHCPTVGERTK